MSIPNNLNLLKLGYAIDGRSAQNSPLKQSEVLFGIREYTEGAMIEHHHATAKNHQNVLEFVALDASPTEATRAPRRNAGWPP